MKPTCSSCRHWEQDGEGATIGECRASAPPAVTLGASIDDPPDIWGHWPQTLASERCGEWQPMPLAQGVDVSEELERLRAEVASLRAGKEKASE